MEYQRLRLVQNGHPRRDQRASDRRALRVPGQLVWKDAHGATKLARVLTRDVSDLGVAVDCLEGGAIPLYRLVYVQIDRSARERTDQLPESLRRPAVLSAVYRVGPSRQSTGTPESYALRLLAEPKRAGGAGKQDTQTPAGAARFMRSA